MHPPSPDVITQPFMPLFAFIISYGMGYLLGSIPFGLILTKYAGEGDIRAIGSGNIGATNVLRTGRRGLAALTLVLDALKGVAAVMIGMHYTPMMGLVAGATALLGHSYPIWLKYKGGKGVATACGITFGIYWPLGLAVSFTWIVVLAMVRYSSVAALSAASLSPLYAYILGRPDLAPFFAAIAAFIWWRHRKNIRQLADGTEPQAQFGKKTEAADMEELAVPAETTEPPPKYDLQDIPEAPPAPPEDDAAPRPE